MKVNGTKYTQIMISESEQKRIVIEWIYKTFDINKFDMIDVDSRSIIQWEDERRGSLTKIRRPATDDDIAAFRILSKLKN